MLHTVEDTPNLGMHRYPSAALFRAIRGNLLALDGATRIGRSAYCGGYGHPQEYANVNPYRESWGAFRALPGLTTLTVVTRSSDLLGNTDLRVYLNGTLASTKDLANGLQTHTVSLGSYAINSVVEVQLDVVRADLPAGESPTGDSLIFGTVEVEDAYVSPVTLADPWPGTPTFGASYDAAMTQQLADAVDWLIRRVGRRTDPLFQAVVRWKGPYGPRGAEPGQADVRWFGSVQPQASAATLYARGNAWVSWGATEAIRLWAGGSVVATYTVPTTPGVYSWLLSYSLPQAAGTHVPLAVDYVRTAMPSHLGVEPINRWSVLRVWTEGAQGLYPVPSIPAPAARVVTTAWDDALNAASSAAATIKARIDANPDLWSRQRLYRRRYAYDDYQDRVYEPGQIAFSMARTGEALLVRGQNARVEWGPQVFDETYTPQTDDVGLYPLKGVLSQAVCQGDAPMSELVYLGTLGGLYPTASYNVRGEALAYAAEVWRVGTDVS